MLKTHKKNKSHKVLHTQHVEPKEVATFGFGKAIELLENGHKVSRTGWNGKNMWLAYQAPDKDSKMTLPYIYMKTADNNLVPWLASQTDILAKDWQLVAE